MVCSTLSFGQTTSTQCTATTKQNVQCKNATRDTSALCYSHNPNYVKESKSTSVVCSGTTKSGNSCKRKTKNLSGLCFSHKKD
jgi:hypothetical protein